jgi:hypothetical protein
VLDLDRPPEALYISLVVGPLEPVLRPHLGLLSSLTL